MTRIIKKEAEFKINDEELDQLKEKLTQSFKYYKDCFGVQTGIQEQNKASKIKIKSKNRLMDLDPQVQDQARQILLGKLQKSSFVKNLEVYPEAVFTSLKKKLGDRVNTPAFMIKMTKHCKRQIVGLTEKQNAIFKRYSTFYSKYSNHENFRELKHMFDVYSDKLAKGKEIYADTYYRLSHELNSDGTQKPDINLHSSNKLLFSHKAQPPAQKSVRPFDFKIFLNDQIRDFKATRKIKKLKEVIQFYPLKAFHKLVASESNANMFASSMVDNKEETQMAQSGNITRNPKNFRDFDDIEELKTSLVEICKSFDINDDINVDNGAYLLFKVQCAFKEKYPIQQKQLNFLSAEAAQAEQKKTNYTEERNWGSNETKAAPQKNRVRYLKKATWIQNFVDYDEVSINKKQHDIIYGEQFDSLLKSCFEFAQLSDVNESLVKIDFKIERLKDEYEKTEEHKESIFFEFLKAYMKMTVLKTRESIIKLYDSLNYFRSIERSIDIRKKEIHSNSKTEFAELLGKNSDRSKLYGDESPRSANKEVLSAQMLKNQQDHEAIFYENTIDILNSDQERIIYDVVQKDFDRVVEEVLKVGAHFIDSARNSQKAKKSAEGVSDNFNREDLLATLLDHEANYQFEKAKFIESLFEIFQNTWKVKHNMAMMNYMATTMAKRPKFDLFSVSMESSYVNETSYYKKLAILASSMVSYQKEQENSLKDLEKQIFAEGIQRNLSENQDRPILDRLGSNDESHLLSELEADEDPIGVEKEFQKFKAYDFLIPAFYIVNDIEKSLEASVRSIIPNYDFSTMMKIQNIVVEDITNAWQQIKYDISLVPAMKDYEFLECDVLLDVTNSYQMFKGTEKPSIVDLDVTERNKDDSRSRPASGSYQKQSTKTVAGKKEKEFYTEEEYIMNYIEFIRLKENLLISFFSCAYQAQIYLDQIKLFGKENIYKDLDGKTDKFQKGFLNLLLNIENIQFSFDIKEMGNSKLLVLDHYKLGDLWLVTEYFLLHDVILQNALFINHFHALDISYCFPNDNFSFLNAIRGRKSQKMFYNVVEKKTSWLVQTKINPLLLIGKTPKGEVITPQERIRGKMESIFEFVRQVKPFIYFDSLKLQTIEVVRNLRQVVVKTGLENEGVFTLCPSYDKDAVVPLSSRGFDDIADTNSLDPIAQENSIFFERYFDNLRRPSNVFIIPSTEDIIQLELDDVLKGGARDDEDQVEREPERKASSIMQLSARVGMSYNEEMGSPRAAKQLQKKRKRVAFFTRPQLEFLNRTSTLQVLELSYYLLETLNFKVLEMTLEATPLDQLLLYVNSFHRQTNYQRNKLRIEQSLEALTIWGKKYKEQATKVHDFSNPKDNDLRDFLRNNLKSEYLGTILATIDTLHHSRLAKDIESIVKLRRFLINLTFNTTNYLYMFANKLSYHSFFNNISGNAVLNEIDIQDSEIMKLIDFAFLDPRLPSPDRYSHSFINVMKDNYKQDSAVQYGLFDLQKSLKTYFSLRLAEIKIKAGEYLNTRNLLPNYQPLQYARETNTILKHNFRFQLVKESYLFIKGRALPFSEVTSEVLSEFNSNVQYHFTRALQSHSDFMANNKTRGTRQSIESVTNTAELGEEKVDTSQFQPNLERINLLKNILIIELEKLILNEGIAYYTLHINKHANSLPLPADEVRGFMGKAREATSESKFNDKQSLLPFLYSFIEKMLSKALFIDALNVGECVVLPVVDLENDLYGLNATLTEYFDQMKFETQQKYQGKISILQNELAHLQKEHQKVNQRLEIVKRDQQKIIESRVAEINSKLIFDCDSLKKKIKYLHDEHDFNIREIKEKTREEFRNKLIEDEVAIKRMKTRFHEYKEGMYFDIRKFIELEKNNTLKMIREKKNQIFQQTQPKERLDSQEDPFDFIEYHDSELATKLYDLLKKTRIFYKFKEAITKEKHDEQISDMEKQLLANKDLLNKVNDLQNAENTLKESLTDVKKELAVVDRHNNLLRKHLHHDQKQKIQLYKKNNESKSDFSQLQLKYEDAIKQKAIMIPSPRPQTATGNSFAAYKYHLSSARILSSYDGRVDTFDAENFRNSAAIGETMTSNTARKMGSNKSNVSQVKPSGEDSARYKVEAEAVDAKYEQEFEKLQINSPTITKSFIESRTPSKSQLFGFDLKTGKKVRKSDNKSFLVKKYNSSASAKK